MWLLLAQRREKGQAPSSWMPGSGFALGRHHPEWKVSFIVEHPKNKLFVTKYKSFIKICQLIKWPQPSRCPRGSTQVTAEAHTWSLQYFDRDNQSNLINRSQFMASLGRILSVHCVGCVPPFPGPRSICSAEETAW